MIDYTKLDLAHQLACEYQAIINDDVFIAVVFCSNYTKYSLITAAKEESYTSLEVLIKRLMKLTDNKSLIAAFPKLKTIMEMNNFTKKELKWIATSITGYEDFDSLNKKEQEELKSILNKVLFMIDNYCEHS
jgi:hypothetical protein